MSRHANVLLPCALICAVVAGAEGFPPLKLTEHAAGMRVESRSLAFEFSRNLQLRVFLKKGSTWITLSPADGLPPAFSVQLADTGRAPLVLSGKPVVEFDRPSSFGQVDRLVLAGCTTTKDIALKLTVYFPKRYPDVAVLEGRFRNAGKTAVRIEEITQTQLQLRAPAVGADKVLFWSLNGGGYNDGLDYILPVRAGFTRDNFTGPKGGQKGGGTPLVDLWRPEMGVAVAALEVQPVLACLPVTAKQDGLVEAGVKTRPSARVPPDGEYTSPRVMIAAHHGDFYDPVVRFRELMGDLGVRPRTDYARDDYAPMWGTWGFKKLFTIETMLAQIPQMRRMGMRDLTMDDGWFDHFGDWRPKREKFPSGDADLKGLSDALHRAGLTFRLWWTPGVADIDSEIGRSHPDWFILDRDGGRAKASWTSYYLCPAYPPVRDAMRRLVDRFVTEWHVDSFKLDGSCLNHAPLCFNPAHHHVRPEESFQQWPDLFPLIREEARRLKPDFRVQLCACGTAPTFHLLAGMEQPTTADPYDDQVTSRTKLFKAMAGARAPVIEEYAGLSPCPRNSIELAARAIGSGAVYGTFHPAMGAAHLRWTAIYNQHRPAQGDYLNLYDIRWDKIEGHAIRKGSSIYYGFFTQKPDEDYVGPVQLRGLERRTYRVRNYAADRQLGVVMGPVAEISTFFHDGLLLVAEPVDADPR